MKEATRIIKNARFDATSMTGNRAAPAQQSGLEAKSLTPRLVAKRSGDGTCQIAVALPDLTALTTACGIEDTLLKKARVRLFDGDGFWPGQAIHAIANKERRVSKLPEPFDAPVLEWKGLPERSLYALSPHMSLVGKPPWLLRRQEDGLFRQSLDKRARPGQSYLLVGSAPVDAVASQALEMEECGGVPGASIYAFGLKAPVSAKAQQTLSLLGIGYSLRARVHTQACQLAQHGRDRDRRPARPVPGPQNRRPNLTRPRNHRLATAARHRRRPHQMDVHNRQGSRQNGPRFVELQAVQDAPGFGGREGLIEGAGRSPLTTCLGCQAEPQIGTENQGGRISLERQAGTSAEASC
jgi:hypothetical protein